MRSGPRAFAVSNSEWFRAFHPGLFCAHYIARTSVTIAKSPGAYLISHDEASFSLGHPLSLRSAVELDVGDAKPIDRLVLVHLL
jgi:hypothetical protein